MVGVPNIENAGCSWYLYQDGGTIPKIDAQASVSISTPSLFWAYKLWDEERWD